MLQEVEVKGQAKDENTCGGSVLPSFLLVLASRTAEVLQLEGRDKHALFSHGKTGTAARAWMHFLIYETGQLQATNFTATRSRFVGFTLSIFANFFLSSEDLTTSSRCCMLAYPYPMTSHVVLQGRANLGTMLFAGRIEPVSTMEPTNIVQSRRSCWAMLCPQQRFNGDN